MAPGPAFAGSALEAWAYRRGVPRHGLEPGHPPQNADGERVQGQVRDEGVNEPGFLTLKAAPHRLEAWRQDDHPCRPHSALGDLTPAEFAKTERLSHDHPTQPLYVPVAQ